jgi:hypothetical protein
MYFVILIQNKLNNNYKRVINNELCNFKLLTVYKNVNFEDIKKL